MALGECFADVIRTDADLKAAAKRADVSRTTAYSLAERHGELVGKPNDAQRREIDGVRESYESQGAELLDWKVVNPLGLLDSALPEGQILVQFTFTDSDHDPVNNPGLEAGICGEDGTWIDWRQFA